MELEERKRVAHYLKGDSYVLLADGSSALLSEIVDGKLESEVLSYNEMTKKFEPAKIIGWRKENCTINDFYLLGKHKTDRRGVAGNKTFIAATENYPIYSDNHWKSAKNMLDQNLSLIDFGLDPIAEQVLYGTLLGDSSIATSAKNSSIFKNRHSLKQEVYLEEKCRILKKLGTKIISGTARDGYGKGKDYKDCYSKTSMFLNNVRNIFYKNGKKEVSDYILDKIGDVGFAFWFMDDGKLKKSKRDGESAWIIHTEGFDQGSVAKVVSFLNQKYDIKSKSYKRENCNGQYIYIPKVCAEKVASQIAKYFHPSMNYKLFEKLRSAPYELENYEPTKKYTIQNQKINKFGKASEFYNNQCSKKPYKWKFGYNLELEKNNNFILNGILIGDYLK
jgi:recombination protein RecA